MTRTYFLFQFRQRRVPIQCASSEADERAYWVTVKQKYKESEVDDLRADYIRISKDTKNNKNLKVVKITEEKIEIGEDTSEK